MHMQSSAKSDTKDCKWSENVTRMLLAYLENHKESVNQLSLFSKWYAQC